jgi:hypothetical protein
MEKEPQPVAAQADAACADAAQRESNHLQLSARKDARVIGSGRGTRLGAGLGRGDLRCAYRSGRLLEEGSSV